MGDRHFEPTQKNEEARNSQNSINFFRWSGKMATLWANYTAPSRPSLKEIEKYKEVIKDHFISFKGLNILILGSTIEFRTMFNQLESSVTVVDRSKEYYETISEELDNTIKEAILTQERLIVRSWHEMDFNNEFDIIIGDLAIGNIMPMDLDVFIKKAHKALKPKGLFIGKSLFTFSHREERLDDKCNQWKIDKSLHNDPYAFFMYDLSIDAADKNDHGKIDFKKIHTKVKSLYDTKKIDKLTYECFCNKGFEQKMVISFYAYDYGSYKQKMFKQGFIKGNEVFAHDVYSDDFPIFIFEKGEFTDASREKVRGFKTDIQSKILSFLDGINREKIKEYTASIGSQYFILNLFNETKIREGRAIEQFKKLSREIIIKNIKFTVSNAIDICIEYSDETIIKENTELISNLSISDDKSEDIAKNYMNALAYFIVSNITGSTSDLSALLLKTLFNEERFDNSTNWHPSYIPWISARALLCLEDLYFESILKEISMFEEKQVGLTDEFFNSRHMIIAKQKSNIDNAIAFLKTRYIRGSGWSTSAEKWVSKEESSALCLDAIMAYDKNGTNENIRIIAEDLVQIYLRENGARKITHEIKSFYSSNTSELLPKVILSSVLIQAIEKYKLEYEDEKYLLLESFADFVNNFNNGANISISHAQRSAEAQILYYLYCAGISY